MAGVARARRVAGATSRVPAIHASDPHGRPQRIRMPRTPPDLIRGPGMTTRGGRRAESAPRDRRGMGRVINFMRHSPGSSGTTAIPRPAIPRPPLPHPARARSRTSCRDAPTGAAPSAPHDGPGNKTQRQRRTIATRPLLTPALSSPVGRRGRVSGAACVPSPSTPQAEKRVQGGATCVPSRPPERRKAREPSERSERPALEGHERAAGEGQGEVGVHWLGVPGQLSTPCLSVDS